MKSRPCGWVFRLSRVSRAVRERRLPRLRGLAGPSYESRRCRMSSESFSPQKVAMLSRAETLSQTESFQNVLYT